MVAGSLGFRQARCDPVMTNGATAKVRLFALFSRCDVAFLRCVC